MSEIIPSADIKSPAALEIRCRVNGSVRQHSRVDKIAFSVEDVISYISTLFTLERGDLIFTGTPQRAGRVQAGDVIEAELVGYTTITHRVASQ